MFQVKEKWSEARRVPQEQYTRSRQGSDAGGIDFPSYGKACRGYWKREIVRLG